MAVALGFPSGKRCYLDSSRRLKPVVRTSNKSSVSPHHDSGCRWESRKPPLNATNRSSSATNDGVSIAADVTSIVSRSRNFARLTMDKGVPDA